MVDSKSSTAADRIHSEVLGRAAAVIKCLGHPLRLRLLEALETGEKTVSELQGYATASQPQVSQQLAILRGHDIVDVRREGNFAFYRVVEPRVSAILECIRASGC